MEFIELLSIDDNSENRKKISKPYNDLLKIFFQNLQDAHISYKENQKSIIHKKMYIDDDNIDLNETNIYFPEIIRDYIQNFSSTKYIYKFNIYDRVIVIEFVFFNTIPNKKEINSHIQKIYMWLHILSLYANTECTKTLKINIYFSNFRKKLPSNTISNKEQILDAINVNTAWTYRCKEHNSITIYRKEEWFKVLCHETIHTFGLDFSSDTDANIRLMCEKIFNVQSDFLLSESYCEFWATIWSTIFNAYCICDSPKDFDIFSHTYDNLIFNEKQFSIFQTLKVLNYMKLNYFDLFDFKMSRKQFIENTNVFCYYIIKTILLFNDKKTLDFFVDINNNILNFENTNKNVIKFVKFIDKNKLDMNFIEVLNEIQKRKYALHKEYSNSDLLRTLKMTLHG
jgi:hypothetical protein